MCGALNLHIRKDRCDDRESAAAGKSPQKTEKTTHFCWQLKKLWKLRPLLNASAQSAILESPSPHQIRRSSPPPPPPSSSANSFINSHFSSGDYNMSSTTPNSVVGSGDCDQESASAAAAAAAAAAVASKNAFLELQQAHHLASAGIGPPPHMSGGPGGPYGMSRNPYQQMQQQHPGSAGQLGGYPFSHMTPQNSYAAAAAAAAAGYHHLSPYPSQCPSPPRDGTSSFLLLRGFFFCFYCRNGARSNLPPSKKIFFYFPTDGQQRGFIRLRTRRSIEEGRKGGVFMYTCTSRDRAVRTNERRQRQQQVYTDGRARERLDVGAMMYGRGADVDGWIGEEKREPGPAAAASSLSLSLFSLCYVCEPIRIDQLIVDPAQHTTARTDGQRRRDRPF